MTKLNVPQLKRAFVCKYCEKSFSQEGRFLKHECKEKHRWDTMHTPAGQRAFEFYKMWFKAQRKATSLSAETFLKSKFFITFNKFAVYAIKMQIPSTDMFIRLMVTRDFPPTIWGNPQVYQMYVEFLDTTLTPFQHIDITVKTLTRFANAAEVDVGEIFDVLKASEIITLLQQRRVSPWVLLVSKKFKHLLVNNTSVEQRIILETIMRPDYWHEKLTSDRTRLMKIKEIVSELNL